METKKTYIGLDIGTDSVGWAVTDETYRLKRCRGNLMWGVHLFDEASQAADRRTFRTARRRLDRRQQRIQLLQELIAPAIIEKDPTFFLRLKESALLPDDFHYRTHNLYFQDGDYDDAAYHRDYPTIHHLICELMNNPEPHDVRLVYIACAYLLAHRGHFLRDIEPERVDALLDFSELYSSLLQWFTDNGIPVPFPEDCSILRDIMLKYSGISAREKAIKACMTTDAVAENEEIKLSALAKLIAGGSGVKLSVLFCKESYTELEKDSVSIAASDFDERLPDLLSQLDDGHCDLLLAAKNIYDWSLLMGILSEDAEGKTPTISRAKVKVYEDHQRDLKDLKYICKTYLTNAQFNRIFRDESVPNNYVWYSYHFKGRMPEKGKKANQEDFCKFVESYLTGIDAKEQDISMLDRLKEKAAAKTLCPKQVTTDNRVIPYQLNYRELKLVLDHAARYIPLLNQKDEYGTVADKILSIMRFRIPYYIGPLASDRQSDRAWMVRKANGKIYPWNFDQMVDHDKSEDCFIRRMTAKCVYLAGEDVLPKNSLLYSKFCVLNEINNLTIDGARIPVEAKQAIYNEFFMKSKRRITKKMIQKFLCENGYMTAEQALSGVDDILKSTLKPHQDFSYLLKSGILTESDAEEIIERITVTTDKTRLRKWLGEWNEEHGKKLNAEAVNYLVTRNYQDYGRLSRKFLESIYDMDPASGELHSENNIIGALWNTNENLMQLLSDKHCYLRNVEDTNRKYYDSNPETLEQKMDALYLSKPVRRAVTRTLDIMKELRSLLPSKPDRIFIEMARGGEPAKKGKTTDSRRKKIEEWLSAMREDMTASEFDTLNAELSGLDDSRLRRDKYYLYFMQLGKCMYTGQPIDFSQIDNNALYNIDHIYPQSKTMDDSIDNQVLVLSKLNGEKSDDYPISKTIRKDMHAFWELLHRKGLISQKKYDRLTRSNKLTDEELSGFIQRQLVETRQSTKAVASLLKELFPETEIVYVKAGLVSQLRHDLDLLKCREINDLHHAKDAYLNIVIGNVYHERFTSRFFANIPEHYSLRLFEKNDNGKARGILNYPLKNAWDPNTSFEIVRSMMHKNSVRYVRYCYRRKGGLFHQQPERANDGLIPRKKELDCTKYGGYSAASSSFFTLVKYADQVTLISVSVMYADQFEQSQEFAKKYALSKYCGKKRVTLDEVQFPLHRRILKINTMLEIDNIRVSLTAEDGSYFLFAPATSLIMPDNLERYIKRLASFMEKKKNNASLTVTSWDKISEEDNILLYDALTEKMLNEPYRKLHEKTGLKLQERKKIFIDLDVTDQVAFLMQAISVLKTGRRNDVDFSLIGGSKRDEKRRLNMKLQSIKNCHSIRVIDQSPTGLIEHRSENLLAL